MFQSAFNHAPPAPSCPTNGLILFTTPAEVIATYPSSDSDSNTMPAAAPYHSFSGQLTLIRTHNPPFTSVREGDRVARLVLQRIIPDNPWSTPRAGNQFNDLNERTVDWGINILRGRDFESELGSWSCGLWLDRSATPDADGVFEVWACAGGLAMPGLTRESPVGFVIYCTTEKRAKGVWNHLNAVLDEVIQSFNSSGAS